MLLILSALIVFNICSIRLSYISVQVILDLTRWHQFTDWLFGLLLQILYDFINRCREPGVSAATDLHAQLEASLKKELHLASAAQVLHTSKLLQLMTLRSFCYLNAIVPGGRRCINSEGWRSCVTKVTYRPCYSLKCIMFFMWPPFVSYRFIIVILFLILSLQGDNFVAIIH